MNEQLDEFDRRLLEILREDRRSIANDLREVVRQEREGQNKNRKWKDLTFGEKKDRIQNFVVSVALVTFVPFLPIFLAYILGFSVRADSVVLTISIYLVTVGLASDEVIFFFIGLLASLIFMVIYGNFSSSAPPEAEDTATILRYAWATAAFITISNVIVCYRDHIYDNQPALRILRGGSRD